MLSIYQLVEKGYKVSFEDKYCFITDGAGNEVLNIKMRGKHFLFDLMEDVYVEHEKDHWLKKLEDDPRIVKAQAKCEPFRFKGALIFLKELKQWKSYLCFRKIKWVSLNSRCKSRRKTCQKVLVLNGCIQNEK